MNDVEPVVEQVVEPIEEPVEEIVIETNNSVSIKKTQSLLEESKPSLLPQSDFSPISSLNESENKMIRHRKVSTTSDDVQELDQPENEVVIKQKKKTVPKVNQNLV